MGVKSFILRLSQLQHIRSLFSKFANARNVHILLNIQPCKLLFTCFAKSFIVQSSHRKRKLSSNFIFLDIRCLVCDYVVGTILVY
jgi:hypothetical protein